MTEEPPNRFIDHTMAPSNMVWHRLYVRNTLKIQALLDELQNDPSFKDGEDLRDWVETIATLMSFRPRTRDDIELDVRRQLGLAEDQEGNFDVWINVQDTFEGMCPGIARKEAEELAKKISAQFDIRATVATVKEVW